MGFDGFDPVEFVRDVENTFGISIPDRDAERIRTAGQLHDDLVRRLAAAPDGPGTRCVGAAAFYRTRRILATTFGTDRSAIAPRTSVEHFLPPETALRKPAWRRLAATLDVRLPEMAHPKSIADLSGRVGLAFFLSALARLPVLLFLLRHDRAAAGGVAATFVALVAAAFLLPSLLLFVTRARAVELPEGSTTVGDLSGAGLGLEIERLSHTEGKWTRREVWEVIRWYTAKGAGVPPAKIRPETNFITDLL